MAFQIESLMCDADKAAQSKGINLSDSQVRSTPLRTIKVLKGQSPEIPKANERDVILARLLNSLLEARKECLLAEVDNEANQRPVSEAMWCNGCETVLASINTRKIDVPGSRLYLDYLHTFIAKIRKSPGTEGAWSNVKAVAESQGAFPSELPPVS